MQPQVMMHQLCDLQLAGPLESLWVSLKFQESNLIFLSMHCMYFQSL
jgi:hypothetical protein